MRKQLMTTGIVGTLVSALCCFTPLAVSLLGAMGLAAWVGWLDLILIPALVFFIALTAYAFFASAKSA